MTIKIDPDDLKPKQKTKWTQITAFTLSGVAVFGLVVTAVGTNAMGFGNASTEVKEALQARDYSAFKEAVSAEGEDKLSSKLENLTEDKFNKIADKFESKEAIKAAIEADDYSLLPANAADKIDQEKFDKMVDRHAEREEFKSAIQTAIINNNFDAYATAIEAKNDSREEGDKGMKRGQREDLTDEDQALKIQERFDQAVSEYEETGEVNFGKKEFHMKGNSLGGKRGWR